jgi:hypothetical protein
MSLCRRAIPIVPCTLPAACGFARLKHLTLGGVRFFQNIEWFTWPAGPKPAVLDELVQVIHMMMLLKVHVAGVS